MDTDDQWKLSPNVLSKLAASASGVRRWVKLDETEWRGVYYTPDSFDIPDELEDIVQLIKDAPAIELPGHMARQVILKNLE